MKCIVTTKHGGVFYGEADGPIEGDRIEMKSVRMLIYWGTTRGLLQLADSGPTDKTRMSSVCPSATILSVTAVFRVSMAAEAQFAACST